MIYIFKKQNGMSVGSGQGWKRVATVALVVLLLFVAAAVGVFAMPASTAPIRDAGGAVAANSIASIESIELNGVQQWLVIRGRDRTDPVLVYVHGGPGNPETAPLVRYNRSLEDDFVVVSWEQRGAGKSYPAGLANPAAVNTAQLVDDLHALTGYLKTRFGQDRLYLVAHSYGTLIAIRAAQRYPSDYHALVSIEQTSNAAREEALMHQWALEQAREDGNEDAVRELTALSPLENGTLPLADRVVRMKWVEHYGGGVMHTSNASQKLALVLLGSSEYTAWEKINYLRAQDLTLARLFPDKNNVHTDLFTEIPALDVPIYFVQGRYDHLVPIQVSRAFYESLHAPHKAFVVFENSAHSPIFEEPERFHELMREVLADTRQLSSARHVCSDDSSVLASRRIQPAKLLAAGHQFRFPDLEGALRHEMASMN
jgi:pimeloyl-ACP methyl ester carboxylesterase